jgi:hypothetical protein
MAALTTDRPTETGSESAGSRTDYEPRRTPLIGVVGGIVVVLAIVVGILVGSAYTAESKNDTIANKDEAIAEGARQDVQRELRAYAGFQDLPVKDIKVSYGEDGSLIVTWKQANQTCTSYAVPPPNDSSLWTAKQVPEGSGGCQTASGSGGIGNRSSGG